MPQRAAVAQGERTAVGELVTAALGVGSENSGVYWLTGDVDRSHDRIVKQ